MDKIKVSQRAREAVAEAVATKQQKHMKSAILMGDYDYTEAVQAIARFERNILATRTDATPVAEVAALRGNIIIMETALQQIAGTHAERFGTCQTDVEEVPDLSAEEAVSIARNALEETEDTHPPATDVAALVEAAKAFQHYGCPVCSGDCGSANPPVIACPMKDLSAALAPFTKGQNDENA